MNFSMTPRSASSLSLSSLSPSPSASSLSARIRIRSVLVAILVLGAALGVGASAVSAQPSPPAAAVEKLVLDLGKINRGDTSTARFVIKNEGGSPLLFENATSSCSCAIAVAPGEIAPGKEGEMVVEVKTENLSGPSRATVSVSTNDPEIPRLQLSIRMESVNTMAAEPGTFRYIVHQHFPGDGVIKQVVFATDHQDFEITGLESPNKFLILSEPRPVTAEERVKEYRGAQWVFEGALQNNAPVGALRGFVRVLTDHPQQKVVPIPVSGFVRPVIALTPAGFNFNEFTPKAAGTYLEVHVKQFLTELITLDEITSDVPGFTFTQRVVDEGREWFIRAIASADAPAGAFRGTVTIKTSSPLEPKIVIPITGQILSPN